MKTHIIATDDRIQEGSDIMAPCGKFLNKIAFNFFIDGQIVGQKLEVPENTMLFCKTCFEAADMDKRYFYGVRSRPTLVDFPEPA